MISDSDEDLQIEQPPKVVAVKAKQVIPASTLPAPISGSDSA
jgi:hypothetical protein